MSGLFRIYRRSLEGETERYIEVCEKRSAEMFKGSAAGVNTDADAPVRDESRTRVWVVTSVVQKSVGRDVCGCVFVGRRRYYKR